MPDTGFPAQDAQSDFSRARRRQVLARLAKRLRREPDDVGLVLPFEEVKDALGFRGERRLGLGVIPLDSIVGSVERSREFDRRFRPTSRRVRDRWQRIATAQRRGEAMPPISVYRIGDMHFVEDGHHRVSVARAQGRRDAFEPFMPREIALSSELGYLDCLTWPPPGANYEPPKPDGAEAPAFRRWWSPVSSTTSRPRARAGGWRTSSRTRPSATPATRRRRGRSGAAHRRVDRLTPSRRGA